MMRSKFIIAQEPIAPPKDATEIKPEFKTSVTGQPIYVFGSLYGNIMMKHYTMVKPFPGAAALCGHQAAENDYKNFDHDITCKICGERLVEIR